MKNGAGAKFTLGGGSEGFIPGGGRGSPIENTVLCKGIGKGTGSTGTPGGRQ